MHKEQRTHVFLTHVEAWPLLPLLADDGHLDGVGPLVVPRLRHAAGKVLKNHHIHAKQPSLRPLMITYYLYDVRNRPKKQSKELVSCVSGMRMSDKRLFDARFYIRTSTEWPIRSRTRLCCHQFRLSITSV